MTPTNPNDLTAQELNEPIQRYDWDNDWMVNASEGDYVTYDDHLATIATLTEKCERLEKVAIQASKLLMVSANRSGHKGVSWSESDEFFVRRDVPELYEFLKQRDGR